MNTFKQRCIALRKKDYTLSEIMNVTGRSKTSVYFHIKSIPLSKQKQEEIAENSRRLALRVAATRKGKAKRPHKRFKHWTPDMVLLVGHLMFDGEILMGRCAYNNRSIALIDRVKGLMVHVYDFPPYERTKTNSDVRTITYNNVELEAYLKTCADELKSTILGMSLLHKREFLRSFFDDEGCMDFRKKSNKKRIRGYQKDRKILVLVQELLTHFDISAKLQGKNEVVITGKMNLKRFQEEINFSKGVRLNPNRKNSTWKRPIEKRVLLDMAIKSFKS